MVWKFLAEPTGLEPATSDVTGRRSNQLNYDSADSIQTIKPGKEQKNYRAKTIPHAQASCLNSFLNSEGVLNKRSQWWAVLGSNQ